MNESQTDRIVVFESLTRAACMDARLVLDASGIASQVIREADAWILDVASRDYKIASKELEAYRHECDDAPAETSRVTYFGGSVFGCFIYSAVLISFAAVSQSQESQPLWHAIGTMTAGDVLDGEVWRVTTALTLHADAAHLISNLGFGCLFGLMAGRSLGGGVAWLAIVVAGSLGNFCNALMRDAAHASIGASTAVFGAIGILVAHTLRPRLTIQQSPMRRWSPLIGGVVLLSLIGLGGERTDVGAHVTGFLAGLLIGWCTSRLPDDFLASRRVQIVSGCIASAIVLAAWAIAIGHVQQASSPSKAAYDDAILPVSGREIVAESVRIDLLLAVPASR